MSIDPDLRSRIRCPATRKPLRDATAAELQQVNAAIAAGTVRTRGGTKMTVALQAALVVDGESILYPIVDGFPILLSSEAVPLPAPHSVDGARSNASRPSPG